jgi:hypothetical protein
MKRTVTLGIVIVIALLAQTSGGAIVNATWSFNGSGDWSTAQNWDIGIVPNNNATDQYNVRIDNDAIFNVAVSLNSHHTINNLIVDAGDQLTIGGFTSNFTLAGSSIVNNGLVSLNTSGISGLRLQSPATTLSGTGTLVMNDNSGTSIRGTAGSNELINTATHTIAGSGWIGLLKLTNQGLIDANDSSGDELFINGTGPFNMRNSGTMKASLGGKLHLASGTFDNTGGGLIHAANGSSVELSLSARIIGGTFTTDGSGRIRIRNATISGTITNNGQWEMKSTGGFTNLRVDGAATLSGTGTLTLVGNQNNSISGENSGAVLTNDVDHTIAGQGQFGAGLFLSIVNKGTIHATDAAALRIVGTGTITNESTGVMRASGSGGLHISNLNNQGLVDVMSGSNLVLGATTNTGTIKLGETGSAGISVTGANTIRNNAGGAILGHGQFATSIINDGNLEGNSDTEFFEISRTLSGTGVIRNVKVAGTHIAGLSGTTAIVPLESSYWLIDDLSHLAVDLGGLVPGTEYDQLSSIGSVSLDGILDVTAIKLPNSYVPQSGDRFTIIESTNPIVGAFDVVNLPAIAWRRELIWKPVDYSNPNAVVLEIARTNLVPEPSSALVLLFVWGAVVRSSRVGCGLDRSFS